MTTTLDQSLIDEIVRRILSVAQPDRIILFGSAATGQMTPDSDIDLLVLDREPGNAWDESTKIRSALRGMGYPFDIIVMETEWFDESATVIGGLAYTAHKHGRVIYRAGPDGQPVRSREEVRRAVVGQWMEKADECLTGAAGFIAAGVPYGAPIGFHAQVAVEACLKAFLAERQIECPKSHDLGVLLGLVAQADRSLAEQLADTAILTPYALYFDDPLAAPEVSIDDARTAVALAQKACDAVREAIGVSQ